MTTSVPAIVSVVVFVDDATELSFTDGSRLALSPCGAGFACTRPAASRGQHPLAGAEASRSRQRTEFATSEFRRRVGRALEFRNRFADAPYLSRQYLPDRAVLKLFADVQDVSWAPTPAEALGKLHPNGSVQVTSADECASLFLSANRQDFTVEFLCRLSRREASRRRRRRSNLPGRTIPGRPEEEAGKRKAVGLPTGRGTAPGESGGEYPTDRPTPPSRRGRMAAPQESPYLQTLNRAQAGPVVTTLAGRGSVSGRPEPVDPPLWSPAGESGNVGVPLLGDGRNGDEETEEVIADRYRYAWVVQHHAVASCPERWRHPLRLAQSAAVLPPHRPTRTSPTGASSPPPPASGAACSDSKERRRRSEEAGAGEEPPDEELARPQSESGRQEPPTLEATAGSLPPPPPPTTPPPEAVRCPLPAALPLACPLSHLHRWRREEAWTSADQLGEMELPPRPGVKVWFSNGIIYRLVRRPQPAVLVFPGDGTLLKSTGPDGGYFVHVIPCEGGRLEERMLRTRSPPPDSPGSAYSVAALLRKALRLLQGVVLAEYDGVLGDERCCWKESLPRPPVHTPRPAVLLEESRVAGLGHFLAFSNGRVRAVFEDRTSLDTLWDFRGRTGASGIGSDGETAENVPPRQSSGVPKTAVPGIRRSVFASGLQEGVCQLLLPSGERRRVPTDDPGQFGRYVDLALEWARWVASSPDERRTFYPTDQPHPPQQNWSVQSELQKMKRFEYILESTLYPCGASSSATAEGAVGSGKGAAAAAAAAATTVHPGSPSPCRPGAVATDAADGLVPVEAGVDTPAFVRDALLRTGSAIRTIDAVLGTALTPRREWTDTKT